MKIAEISPKDPGKVEKAAKVGNPHGAAPILLRKQETGTARGCLKMIKAH